MKEETSPEIESYVQELRQAVQAARLNYEIWLVYKSKDTRRSYLTTMNQYSLFFQTSIHAHFVALLVALYRLYETRQDTYNIPALLKIIRERKVLSQDVQQCLDSLYEQAKPLWLKVNILRNRAFGHRSLNGTVDEVFNEAHVSPNNLEALINLTQRLLNEFTGAWANNSHAFNLGTRDETQMLLRDLKAYHEYKQQIHRAHKDHEHQG